MDQELYTIHSQLTALAEPLEYRYAEGTLTSESERALLRDIWTALFHLRRAQSTAKEVKKK